MQAVQSSVISLDDEQLIEMIRAARRRLLFVAPGLAIEVAQAICDRWIDMGPGAVQVLLDADPEVCRMGYGTIEAIQLLHGTAQRVGSAIHHRPGVRIGLVISDDATLVYSPTPLLVEKLPSDIPHPNAIRLGNQAASSSTRQTVDEGTKDLIRAGEPVRLGQIQAAAQDLSTNPPLKFDLAQKVRVFNAQLEFVEFELRGLAISRKTVPIPSDLMGLARDAKTRRLLRSSFKLVGEDSAVSGESVTRLKERIAKRYLIVLPAYGNVILRSNKARFEAAVRRLKRFVGKFQARVKTELQTEIDNNRAVLVKALMPSVSARPPERWIKLLGPTPSKASMQDLLESELASAFGSADDVLGEMNVKIILKGVTYESLTDAKFVETARKLIPSLKLLHEEYDAARATDAAATREAGR